MPRPARVLELRLCTPHGRGVVSPTRLPTTASIAFHSATASIAVYLDATAAEGSLAHHLPVSAVRCVELSLLPLTTHPTGGLPRAALWVEAAPCEWLPHGGLLSLHIAVDGLVACGVWDALEGVPPPSSVGFPVYYLTAVPWVYPVPLLGRRLPALRQWVAPRLLPLLLALVTLAKLLSAVAGLTHAFPELRPLLITALERASPVVASAADAVIAWCGLAFAVVWPLAAWAGGVVAAAGSVAAPIVSAAAEVAAPCVTVVTAVAARGGVGRPTRCWRSRGKGRESDGGTATGSGRRYAPPRGSGCYFRRDIATGRTRHRRTSRAGRLRQRYAASLDGAGVVHWVGKPGGGHCYAKCASTRPCAAAAHYQAEAGA